MAVARYVNHAIGEHRRVRLAVALLGTATVFAIIQLALLAGSEGAGAVPNVSCGQTLVASVTLNTDLNCTDDGLHAGKSGITINLGGHTISGDGDAIDFGVFKSPAFEKVVVTNGTIANFGVAVRFSGGISNRVEKLRVSDGNVGVQIDGATSSNVVTANTIFNMHYGIVIGGSGKTQITNNNLRSNTVSGGGAGIFLSSGAANVITGNKALNNADGIIVESAATGTQVTSNTALSNDGDGLDIRDATAKLTKNIANFNTGLGIKTDPGSFDGTGNMAHGNGDLHQCENIICA